MANSMEVSIEHEMPSYRLMEVSRSLPADAHAPARARALVRESFTNVLSPERIEDLELLVTELVTNSVQHGKLPPGAVIRVRTYMHDRRVRVEVQDTGLRPRFTSVIAPAPRESGYGLALVEKLSSRWGVHLNGHTSFWFELDL